MSVPMYQVTAILDSTANVWIEDLGIEITDATNGHDLSAWFTYDSLAGSDSLREAVGAGTVVIDNGVENLSAADGVKYLTFIQGQYLEDNYYNKNDLNVAGNSEVHWENITNVPNLGSLYWIDPVLYRVDDITDTPSGSPESGDVYFDTDVNSYYKYIDSTSEWELQGVASDGDRIINLANATENVYVFDSTSDAFVESEQELDNSACLVDDDGDGKQAQYVYSVPGGIWIKIADVDFGGDHRHPADHIDVANAYSNIGNDADDDLETVLNDINNALGNQANENNTLDEAYNQGGPGAGRTITTGSGAVVLDSTSTYAPLELTPQIAAPTSDLQPGQFSRLTDGILYTYDDLREKWLSVDRKFIVFGKAGTTKNAYLPFYGGNLSSNNSGLRMVRDATIISLSGQFDNTGTGTFEIRKNDVESSISTLTITATTGAGDITIDVDLSAGDFLQGFMLNDVNVEDPMIVVEIAWRKD